MYSQDDYFFTYSISACLKINILITPANGVFLSLSHIEVLVFYIYFSIIVSLLYVIRTILVKAMPKCI